MQRKNFEKGRQGKTCPLEKAVRQMSGGGCNAGKTGEMLLISRLSEGQGYMAELVGQ